MTTNPNKPTLTPLTEREPTDSTFDMGSFANALLAGVNAGPKSQTHTPTPWTVDEINTPNGKSYQISHLWEDHDGTHTDAISQIEMDYATGVALANAEMIVRAVNSFEAMLAVIRSVKCNCCFGLGIVRGHCGCDNCCGEHESVCKACCGNGYAPNIYAAIQLAEGSNQ